MSDIAPHTVAWQAAYSGTLDDDFGVEDLFDLSMAELKSITHWEFEDEFEGRVVDLVIVGAEYARKVIIDEKDTTPTEGAAVFGEADEDYSGEVTVVQQIKLLSSHYQYSMMVVHKFEWMTPDLETTVDMDVLEPLIIEKGAEDMATISWIVDEMTAEGAEIEEEDEENQEATRRHLMGRCRPSWGRRCKMKRKKEELLKLRIRVALLWRKKAMESPLAAFKKTGQITKPKTRAIDAGKKVFNKVKNGLMTAVNWYGCRAARQNKASAAGHRAYVFAISNHPANIHARSMHHDPPAASSAMMMVLLLLTCSVIAARCQAQRSRPEAP